MENSILRLPIVSKRTGLSRSAIYQRIATGDFPESIRLGSRAVGWVASDIDAWIDEQIKKDRKANNSKTIN